MGSLIELLTFSYEKGNKESGRALMSGNDIFT